MLGTASYLLGGGETQSTSTSTPIDLTPDAYKGLRDPFASALTSYIGAGGTPQYGGLLNAPITGTEQTALGGIGSLAGPDTGRNSYLNDVLAGKYLPGQGGTNPFLQASIEAAQRPTFEGLQEVLGRTLPGRFTAAGQFVQPQGSSAFDRAAAIATRGAANAAGDIATRLSAQNFEAERARQQQAVPLQQAEVDTAVKNLQAQALPRMIQELGIERGLALFQQRTQQLLQLLQMAGAAGAPVIGNQQTSQSTGETSTGVLPSVAKLFQGAGTQALASAG